MSRNGNRAVYTFTFTLLLAVFLSLPFDELSIIAVVSLSDLLIVLLFSLVAGTAISVGELRIRQTSALIAVCLSVTVLARAFPLLVGANYTSQLKFVLTGFIVLLFHLALSTTIETERELTTILGIVFVSAVIINFVNILQAYEIITLPNPFSRFGMTRTIGGVTLPVRRRSVAVFSAFGSYGVWSVLATGTMVTWLLNGKRINQIAAIVGGFIVVYGSIFVLQSRSVWLGQAVTLGTAILFLVYRYRKRYNQLIWLIAIACVVSFVFITPKIIQILISVNESTLDSRLIQYRFAFETFVASPLFGSQFGTIRRTTGFALHNFYLQTLVYSGIIGGVSFLAILILLGRKSTRRCVNRGMTSAEIGLISSLGGALTIAAFYPAATSYLFWVIISLVSVALDISEADTEAAPFNTGHLVGGQKTIQKTD